MIASPEHPQRGPWAGQLGSDTGASVVTARLLVQNLVWILLVTFAVTAGAAFLSWSRTPIYRAQAEVLVGLRVFSDAAAPRSPDMGTEKELVSSGTVLAPASKSLGLSGDELSRGLSVRVPVDSRVLHIAYSHPDPKEAQRRAQRVADAYVLSATKISPLGRQQATVITPASLPKAPASPNHLTDVGVALVIGLALGMGLAIVREILDDRLRGARDFEAHLGAPVLALIPAFRHSRRDPASRLVALHDQDHPAADAYRDLRTRVLQAAVRRRARTLLVTSPAGEDSTSVSANLATALALSGKRVALLSADLRRATTHELFGLDNQVGLAAVVAGDASMQHALRETAVDGLRLLPAGTVARDPGVVLLAPALKQVFGDLRHSFELVIIDAPPLLTGADAGVLAELTDMILVVGDARRSTRGGVRAAVREMDYLHHKLIGCVLANNGRRPVVPGRLRFVATRRETGASPLDDLAAEEDIYQRLDRLLPTDAQIVAGFEHAQETTSPLPPGH